jgi:hypothetical protein
MENFDLHFSRVSNIGVIQQELKVLMDISSSVVDKYSAEQHQHMIDQTSQSQWPAVAQLTLCQFFNDVKSE